MPTYHAPTCKLYTEVCVSMYMCVFVCVYVYLA